MIWYKGICPLCHRPFITRRAHTEVCPECKDARSNLRRKGQAIVFETVLTPISEADALLFLASLVQPSKPDVIESSDLQAKLEAAQQEAAYWRGRAEVAEDIAYEKLRDFESRPVLKESKPKTSITEDLIGEVKSAAYEGSQEATQNFLNSMNKLLGIERGPKPLPGANTVKPFDENALDDLGDLIQ